MNATSLRDLAAVLKRRSGLILAQDKGYLVESRLTPLVKQFSLQDLDTLVRSAISGNETHITAVTEAMTTNETSFFRDTKPFEVFRKITLPDLIERNAATKSLRIWSAAASTGQEAYSLAMILMEEGAKLAGWKIEIIGTDICEAALTQAKLGQYSHFEVQRGLPAALLVKYFQKTETAWRVNPALRGIVQFRRFNLLDPLSQLGTFDAIFCRNVLIYFDVETKGRVLEGMSKLLKPGSALFLGGAETVLGITDQLAPVPDQRGVYRLATPSRRSGAGSSTEAVAPRSFAGAPAVALV